MYMTFDDGPNEGTPYVLDALKQVKIVIVKLMRAPSHHKPVTCHHVSGGGAGHLLHQLRQPAHGRPGRGRQEQGVPHPHGEELRVRAGPRVQATCHGATLQVTEGHVIGDHSYDHMAHNTIGDTPRNAYVGLDSDITWFGQKSIDPATLTLKEAGAVEWLCEHYKGRRE